MKRASQYLFTLLIGALASCQSDPNEVKPVSDNQLLVSIEDIQTRSSLYENAEHKNVKTQWEVGDQIKLYSVHDGNVYSATYSAQESGSEAKFSLDSEETGFNLGEFEAAYYPGENATDYDEDAKKITATIPSTQTYAANSFGNGAAPMTSNVKSGNALYFRNAFSVLKLNLIGSKKISQIRVSAPSLSTSTALSGSFDFTLSGSNTVNSAKNTTNDAGYEVTLDCSTMTNALTSTATPFYIALPPMPNSTKMSVDVIGDDGIVKSFTTTTTTTIGSVNSFVQNYIVNMPNLQPSIGLFSVSANKQVRFSPGNMYYTSSTDTYSFEAHQYDFRHYNTITDDVAVINGTNTTTPAGTVGSFFWSNTASVAYAKEYSDASAATDDVLFTNATATTPNPTFTCNGTTGVWRTLSGGNGGEWEYLITKRTDAKKKRGAATVAGVYGNIILPDVFTDPNKNTALGATDGTFVPLSTTGGWGDNVYTVSDWGAMEAAGAVFLPAAGYFSSKSKVTCCLQTGPYWSSNCNGTIDNSFYINFVHNEVGSTPPLGRNNSLSIRLVKDAITEYSATQDYINGNTITLE